MTSNERHFLAYLDEMNIITILLPRDYHNGLASAFFLSCGLQNMPLEIREQFQMDQYVKYICYYSKEISFDKTNWIMDEYGGQTDLQIGAVIRTRAFDDQFFYNGSDLGVRCVEDQTQFKLWAPTATEVKLKLISPNKTSTEWILMEREDKGVWSTLIRRDLEYFHYSFSLCVNQEWREAVDPYTTAATPNGDLGIVIKLEKTTRPKPHLPMIESPVDAIIYETHIRDFTIHPNSGVKAKGLYIGAGEINTKGKEGKFTGLTYVKNLGITHIEFLPFHDFAGVDELTKTHEYNWGYNPIHYNVPDGSYSTDPSNPYSRIEELKYLIEQVHKEGLRVIMDVVYNHVYIREQSSFEKIVPGYYFRHNEFGIPSNGTGVGNDIASERLMVRKFILDSIRFWLEEYHIDGFRFDLMGILDIDTMNEVKKVCDDIKEDVLLIGEGWNLNTPLPTEMKASLFNQAKIPGIAQFNDFFRDSIKGSTFNLYDKGYAFGNEYYFEFAKEAMAGSIGLFKRESKVFNEPFQSVNYVECHDNHTLWDKLFSCLQNEDQSLLRKYHRLATSMVILSQGIPFLHSGQEFFRTKNGDGNSYKSSDSVNQLDWDMNSFYFDNVEYLKGLITIRKKFDCFRMRSTDQIRKNMQSIAVPAPVIGFSYLNHMIHYSEIRLFINPALTTQVIKLPEGEWDVLVDEKNSAIHPAKRINKLEIELKFISLMIIGKCDFSRYT